MNSSNNLLTPRLPSKWVVFTALAAVLVGFADSLYLTVSHYQQVIPPCTIAGCETVLTSRFSTMYGLPISLIGLVGYAVIGFLLLWYLDKKDVRVLPWIAGLAALSLAVSVVLVYLQLFVLNAVCIYCVVSAATATVLFAAAIPFWKYK